jgi:hypothetical protein
MAKRQVRKYLFVPGGVGAGRSGGDGFSGYIAVEGKQDLFKLLLITNVTRGVIYYNFADTQNTGATVTYRPGGIKTNDADNTVVTYDNIPAGTGTVGTALLQNAITLGETYIYITDIDTSTHNPSDEISIFIEEQYQLVRTWNDFGTDAIERQRVANPQSQIDADFEYGLQGTKWQGFETVNAYPSVYELPGAELPVTAVETNGSNPSLVTVTSVFHGLVVNDAFTLQQLDVNAPGFTRGQGTSLVYSVTANTFTYFAKGEITSFWAGTNNSIISPRTIVRKGGFYSGADLPVIQFNSNGATPSSITIHFSSPHGFTPGMPLMIGANSTVSAGQFANLPGGYYANSIPTAYQVEFAARGQVITGGNIAPDTNTNQFRVYTRNDGFFLHRPGDGGVLLGTASAVHGAAATRQSKKYFRYQSGKGFLYTTGVLFAPNYDVTDVQSSGVGIGSTITIETAVPHGCQIGAVIRLQGIATGGYNAQYTVIAVDSDVQLKVIAVQLLDSTEGDLSKVPKLYMFRWHGSVIRTGPHDDANGMFLEYDGSQFNAVKRTSTLQLAGTATFTVGSNTIYGANTLWGQQLKIGDRVVIKGMVHKVNFITTGTEISVTPDFRGSVTSDGNYMYKVEEVRIKQEDFNYDTVDGSGSSGYKFDPNHMQMIGIQFTWYGAGFMDFMIRGTDANFIIMHRMKQNNINVTASMRSANLPVRYEVNNEGAAGVTALKTSVLGASITATMAVENADFFPDSGFVYMNYELIKYNSISRNDIPWPTLNSLTRCAGANVFLGGAYRTIHGRPVPQSHGEGSGVELVSLVASPNMSHWGSSYIMDGGFDLDRGYAFSYSQTPTPVYSNLQAYFGIRLAPSASNGLTGDLGVKELLNRAQLLLQDIDVTVGNVQVAVGAGDAPGLARVQTGANTSILVQGILNPANYSENETWTSLNATTYGNQPSFTQIATIPTFAPTTGNAAIAGEKIFEFVSSPGQSNQLDLSGIKELTQSAIGGRGTFPNGSDTLYINMALYPTDSTGDRIIGNVSATLRWNEAQA